MEKFLEQMSKILEEDSVKLDDELEQFDAWDSLTILSIIAYASEGYGIIISAKEIREAHTVEGIWKLIQSKK